MSNDLVNIDLSEFETRNALVQKLVATKYYTTLGEAGICAIIIQARSLGMDPMQALNGGLFCMNGKVGMPSETMAALIRAKGHKISKDAKSNDTICILHGTRKDTGETWTCSFSKEDAEKAGLWNGPVWKKYPTTMLYNRAMGMLARQCFPDVIKNCGYGKDELEEITATEVTAQNDDVKRLYIEQQPSPNDHTITKEQMDEIVRLAEATPDKDKSLVRICKAGAVNNIAFFPKEKYNDAVTWLQGQIPKQEEVVVEVAQ